MKMPIFSFPARRRAGFTLLELLIAMAVFSIILLVLMSMTDTASNAWTRSEERVESAQSARATLELLSREMTPATIDTCQQFVVMPAETLSQCGAQGAVEHSQVAFWMAPLGKDGDLRAVGYYLQRVDERRFYRLKRIYIGPENEDYYPAGFDSENPVDPSILADAEDAGRLLGTLNDDAFNDSDPSNNKSVVSTVADGVIALWIQCYDLLGNPIPWVSEDKDHPESTLMFNSAALFKMATSRPFENGKTFVYLPDHAGAVKGNRLPAAVEIAIVTLDNTTLDQRGTAIPAMENILTESGSLDLEASLSQFQKELLQRGFNNARTHSTRIKLATGS
jgi:prepilin-type N-terminal cleavage/methylation domain-containing protein